ncbi:GNAT family N-acetyltransferase [Olivibacter domesticus]|uniref:Protein N-acetyltransferase, RimJ/RimL family n=1 Tax=Olivibacter domesticus TaxID=407022 RepID=A0A1H7MB22_OLID1|nr:GNAT family N-acetyltransferase [Olivibacter domesticus]SEL07807.1 Protein N-acetyltransferase, RimJ/RimL family [Olivibacter domesticus]
MQENPNAETIETKRLNLSEVNFTHAAFIFELLNTPGWLAFIGERNIKSLEDAGNYIQKIQESTIVNYWVASLKEGGAPIGIITYIKRDYLEHWDIGFAFLPAYGKLGYAYEAAKRILKEVLKNPFSNYIVATVIQENTLSIKLLEKLGLTFQEEIERDGKLLCLYGKHIDKLA